MLDSKVYSLESVSFTLDNGKNWSVLSTSISPKGIVSIYVMSHFLEWAHFKISFNSNSLVSLSATVFIFIFRPTSNALSMPFKTWSRSPRLVKNLKSFGFKVSIDTLILLTPWSKSCSAYFSNWDPFVVNVSSDNLSFLI